MEKAAIFTRLLYQSPGEARDRLLTLAEFQLDRLRRPATWTPATPAELEQRLQAALGAVRPYLAEEPLHQIEREVSRKQRELGADPGFEMFHGADFELARFCYAVCRSQKPEVVVETGVAHGVSSAFLLQALAVNGNGALWSVDLPPLREVSAGRTGCLVPQDLRGRWHLLRGRTLRLLPQLVSRLPVVDVFLHDSLHTFRTMQGEFRTVWPKLRKGGVLICDDVERNRAFENFARRPDVGLAVTATEAGKAAAFGVMVKAAR